MQYPAEIPGITNAEFIRAAMNAGKEDDEKISVLDFITKLDEKMELLGMREEMAERYLNEGFSGGEKKRNEILQLLMLEPKFALLDEIDSGLDIDALKWFQKGLTLCVAKAWCYDYHSLPTSLELHHSRCCTRNDGGSSGSFRWS